MTHDRMAPADWIVNYANAFFKPAPFPRPYQRFNWTQFDTLGHEFSEFVVAGEESLGIVPLCTYDLEATQIVHGGDNDVFFFNTLNAAMAKTAIYQLLINASQDQIFEFFKDLVSSQLFLAGCHVQAFALRDEKISFFYTKGLPKPPDYYFQRAMTLHHVLPKIPFQEVFPIVDLFLCCHELSHYRITRKDDQACQLLKTVDGVFDNALDITYPADHLAFRQKVEEQYGFSWAEDDATFLIQKKRQELESRRYLIVEEITCDVFAFMKIIQTNIDRQQTRGGPVRSLDEMFASVFLVAQVLGMLHFFAERAVDIAENHPTFDSRNASDEMFFRNVAVMWGASFVLQFLSTSERRPKSILFNNREIDLRFGEVLARMKKIREYVDMYVQWPFGIALHHVAMAMNAKLAVPLLRDLYEGCVGSVDHDDAVAFTSPYIESFVLEHYFSESQ